LFHRRKQRGGQMQDHFSHGEKPTPKKRNAGLGYVRKLWQATKITPPARMGRVYDLQVSPLGFQPSAVFVNTQLFCLSVTMQGKRSSDPTALTA
jgi:hypothetical protein